MPNKTPLITIACLIAAVVVVLTLTIPGYQRLAQRKMELASEQVKLQEAKEINQKLEDLIEQYNRFKDEAEKIAMALPTAQELPSLLVTLETISATNGLVLQSLDFSVQAITAERIVVPEGGEGGQVAPPAKPFHKLNLKMSLNGSYNALKNFLASLEQNLRIIDVESIDFGKTKTGTPMMPTEGVTQPSDIFDYDISAVTYYR